MLLSTTILSREPLHTADPDMVGVWNACDHFMQHLYWYNRRLVTLGPKIEGLPDDHPSKPSCLTALSLLFDSVGNYTEHKRLTVHTLELWRQRGDDSQVANTLLLISGANRLLGLHKDGIRQVEETSEIYGRLDDSLGQARALQKLTKFLYYDGQLDAAEGTASRAIDLSEGSDQLLVCRCYRIRGSVCRAKGETGKALNNFEAALEIASPPNWHDEQFWIHCSLVDLFLRQKGSTMRMLALSVPSCIRPISLSSLVT